VVFATSFDAVQGTARSPSEEAVVSVENAGVSVTSSPYWFMPELGVEGRAGPFVLGTSIGVLFVPVAGPDLPLDAVTMSSDSCHASPESIRCAPYSSLRGERAYGPFFAVVPSAHATYLF